MTTTASGSRPPADATPTVPTRRLSLLDVLFIGVNAIVGSGVFALPDDMYRAMGIWSPLAFALCALLLLPVALCFCELASGHDESGGAYLYAHRAFGARIGFAVGWVSWMNTFLSWAANTTLFVSLLGAGGLVAKAMTLGAVGALALVNYRGVKPGARVIGIFVAGKVVAILCFIVAGFFAAAPSRLGSAALPHGLAGVGGGIYLALFPLQGFEGVPVAAGETQNPERNVPRATIGALVLSAILFVLVQTALVLSYPNLGVASDHPLVDAARWIDPRLGAVVLIGSIVSIGGFTAGSALASPRYAHALAVHGMLPQRLAARHPRFGTPHIAIVVTAVFAAGVGLLFDYRRLVGLSNVTVLLQYFATCIAVPVLRRRAPIARGGWVIPGGMMVPVLGAISSVVLIYGATRSEMAVAAACLVLGALVVVAHRYNSRRLAVESRERLP